MSFSAQQVSVLSAPLNEALIHTRRKQGIELRYLEGFEAINQANAIFGYHCWSYRLTKLELLAGLWIATVLLTVTTPTGVSVEREDVGVGIPAVPRDSDSVSPDALETAIKGAVTARPEAGGAHVRQRLWQRTLRQARAGRRRAPAGATGTP